MINSVEHKLSEFSYLELTQNELLFSNPEDYSEGFFRLGNILVINGNRFFIKGVFIKYLLGNYALGVKISGIKEV